MWDLCDNLYSGPFWSTEWSVTPIDINRVGEDLFKLSFWSSHHALTQLITSGWAYHSVSIFDATGTVACFAWHDTLLALLVKAFWRPSRKLLGTGQACATTTRFFIQNRLASNSKCYKLALVVNCVQEVPSNKIGYQTEKFCIANPHFFEFRRLCWLPGTYLFTYSSFLQIQAFESDQEFHFLRHPTLKHRSPIQPFAKMFAVRKRFSAATTTISRIAAHELSTSSLTSLAIPSWSPVAMKSSACSAAFPGFKYFSATALESQFAQWRYDELKIAFWKLVQEDSILPLVGILLQAKSLRSVAECGMHSGSHYWDVSAYG